MTVRFARPRLAVAILCSVVCLGLPACGSRPSSSDELRDASAAPDGAAPDATGGATDVDESDVLDAIADTSIDIDEIDGTSADADTTDADASTDAEADVTPAGCDDPWGADPLQNQPRGELPGATNVHRGQIDGADAIVASRDGQPPAIIEVSPRGRIRVVAELGTTSTTEVIGTIDDRWYLSDWPGGSLTEATIGVDGTVTPLDQHVRAVGLPQVAVHRDAIAFIGSSGAAMVGPWRESLDATIAGAHAFRDAPAYGVKLIDGPDDGAPFVVVFDGSNVTVGRVPADDTPTVLGTAELPNASPYDVDLVLPPGGGWVVVGHSVGWSAFRIDGSGLSEVASVADRAFGPVRQVTFLQPPTRESPDARVALGGDGFTRVLQLSDDAFTWGAGIEPWAWLGGAPLLEADDAVYSLESARPIDDGGVPFLPLARETGSTTTVDLDGDGTDELFVATPETFESAAWRLDRTIGPSQIEHAYNGLAARYDSCEAIPSDAGGEALICQGNFLVRLELIETQLSWARFGTEYFDVSMGFAFGIDRVAARPEYAVITVDLSNFDGLDGFPIPAIVDTRASFVVPADTTYPPFPAGSEPDLLGSTSFRDDRGDERWVTWGGSGMQAWTLESLSDGAAFADAPVVDTGVRDVAAVRRASGAADDLLVATAEGVRRYTIGPATIEGPLHELDAAPVAVWGRRAVRATSTWAAVDEAGSVWVASPPPGTRGALPVTSLALVPRDIAGGDYDGDGTTDLAIASSEPAGVAFLFACDPGADD